MPTPQPTPTPFAVPTPPPTLGANATSDIAPDDRTDTGPHRRSRPGARGAAHQRTRQATSRQAEATPALPLAGPSPADGSAQAVVIAPSPQAANAADPGVPSDTQSLFFLVTVVLLGVPALLLMTLLATVLTRR